MARSRPQDSAALHRPGPHQGRKNRPETHPYRKGIATRTCQADWQLLSGELRHCLSYLGVTLLGGDLVAHRHSRCRVP